MPYGSIKIDCVYFILSLTLFKKTRYSFGMFIFLFIFFVVRKGLFKRSHLKNGIDVYIDNIKRKYIRKLYICLLCFLIIIIDWYNINTKNSKYQIENLSKKFLNITNHGILPKNKNNFSNNHIFTVKKNNDIKNQRKVK